MVVRRRVIYFNPRSPHGERQTHSSPPAFRKTFQPTLPARGATIRNWRKPADSLFQPTLPARGATRWWSQRRIRPDFNPRSPHGERRQPHGANAPKFGISTHAPRTGSDGHFTTAIYRECAFQPTLPARGATVSGDVFALFGIFQPTLPARGATPAAACLWARKRISTHAPRTGSDGQRLDARGLLQDFNPRSPHGERQLDMGKMLFQ